MNELESVAVESNYPRAGNAQVVDDVSRLRALIDAYYQCNYAVIVPILGFFAWGFISTAFWTLSPIGFRLYCPIIAVLALVFVFRPASTYAEAKGLHWLQKWLYILGSALTTPFCVGFLVVAALQNGIYMELVKGGLISNKERLNRKRAETVLNLAERNKRI